MATLLAAFYAFVILAPHAALALDAGKILHCLNGLAASEQRVESGTAPHQHSGMHEKTDHEHAGKAKDGNGSGPPIACCGLFSVTALPVDVSVEFGVAPRVTALVAISPERRDGEGPGNISKPPKA